MTVFTRSLAAVAAAAVLATGAARAQDDATVINWGLLAVESQDNLMKRWGPLLEALSAEMGVEVKPFFATDYTGVIEGMRFGKVDVVLAGNKSGMTAVDRANAEVFAQEVEADGSAGYYSVLVTQADNEAFNSLEDVLATCEAKSIDFGIGDPQSTSGFLVPTTFIFAANEITPQECFSTVRNASHEANLLAVANGQVDVATANTSALYARLQVNNPEAFAKVKEIWRSPLIASDPLLWRADMDEDLKAKLYYSIMTFGRIGTPEEVMREREILANGGFRPFTPSSNSQLLPFREMEANKAILQIQVDETMSAEEKEAAIAEQREIIANVRELVKQIPNM
ncbi:MAG: phosphonate ABC transporter substrate-binding protein [Paracoccaceae bacterium]